MRDECSDNRNMMHIRVFWSWTNSCQWVVSGVHLRTIFSDGELGKLFSSQKRLGFGNHACTEIMVQLCKLSFFSV